MIDDESGSRRPPWLAPATLVAVAAVVMGLPTLGGGFVGGDDHRLVLNHVLVNHPSLSHAARLFTIVHRDLYQPLPLLTFSAEFAAAKALGLFTESVAGGARLFHLTNIILHALNAVLVWAVIVRLHGRVTGGGSSGAAVDRCAGTVFHKFHEYLSRRLQPARTRERHPTSRGTATSRGLKPAAPVETVVAPFMKHSTSVRWDAAGSASAVATVAALLFAIHPLQTEVVAWLNGRMMLMSTAFALGSLLTFASWLDRRRRISALLTMIFVLFSAISKVRIGLPFLLLIVALARRAKLDRRFLFLWVPCSLVTGVFVLVNIQATAGAALFSEAAEHLHGPRGVRVLLALACYFEHLVWPAGLASYYPTPPVVRWSDPSTWRAMMVAVPGLAALAYACWRSRVARLGVLWFFATLASTLPFFPARNVLAADRYMYLPIIGLFWLIAMLGCAGYQRWMVRWSPVARRVLLAVVAALVVVPMIGTSWRVASFYETPLLKTTRITRLFPDTPRVWERLGWSYYSLGDYAEAIECAQKELRHDSPNVRSGAYQLLGMCELRLGNDETGLELLHKAIEADPKNPLGKYRLGMGYEELGRPAEALPHFEAAVDAAPLNNPTINRLASVYRRLGRAADARAMYEKALKNNRYEVPATMGLVELDIQEGTRESYLSAERRLATLLDWMPESTAALTNLGVVRRALGRTDEAIRAYTEALARSPSDVTASLNLAQLYHATGDVARARPLFERALAGGVASIDQAIVVHDFFVSQGAADRVVALWEGFVERFSDVAEARAFAAWSYALADVTERARPRAAALTEGKDPSPLALATLAYVDLAEGRYDTATARTGALAGMGQQSLDARRRLLGALERFDQKQPNIPWTFCLATQLLIADGNFEGANLFVGLCEERCDDAACREQVARLRSQITSLSQEGQEDSGPP